MAAPWLADPLGYLIGPERIADFFARIYESEALVVTHDAPKRFEGLLSIDDVDLLITNVDLREGQLDMANAAQPIRRQDYIDEAGYVDRGSVADFHRGGATIILNQAHQSLPPLGRLCRALEYVFSCHVQTNLYLTPANAQGFRTHYDNHDVLVLQIEGEKLWRLYDKPVDTPYRGEAFEHGKYETGELKQEFLLKAGDCAYVPRGLMHDAIASGSAPSLHITVGLIVRTWADLMLEAVSEVALRSRDLRRSLPPGHSHPGFDREAWRAHLRKLAEHVAKEIKLDPALDLLADNFIRSRGADNRFAVRDAGAPMTPTQRLKRHPFTPFRLAEDGGAVVVISPGGELKFGAEIKPALERALDGEAFTVADLNIEHAEAIAAKLVAYGLLVRL
jgi:hypothetical protein